MADPVRDPDPGRPGFELPQDPPAADGRAARHRPVDAVITDARTASSEEMSGRIRRYTITMAFRMACFLGMIFVSGWLRWALLAFAVFLPYIAVVFANQSDQRSKGSPVERGAPADAPQLTTGDQPEVISGQVVEDGPEPRRPYEDRSHQPDPPAAGRDV